MFIVNKEFMATANGKHHAPAKEKNRLNLKGLWRIFQVFGRHYKKYAESYLARPEDVASHFVLRCFEEWGLHAMREAEADFLKEFSQRIRFFDQLRVSI